MTQFDWGTMDPFVDDGVQLANQLNSWRDAIHSWHRGPSRPSYVVPGMMWINDAAGPTTWLVNVYLSPTVGDVPMFAYDTTTGQVSMSAATGGGFAAAILLAQATVNPSVRWNSTNNPIDIKAWRATVTLTGALRFSAFSDAGVEQGVIEMHRDGSVVTGSGGAAATQPRMTGAIVPFGGSAEPSWGVFANGQAISRATYAALFAIYGTYYGAGNGSSTFNVPNFNGRVVAGLDRGAGNLTAPQMSPDGNTLGATGGQQTEIAQVGVSGNTGGSLAVDVTSYQMDGSNLDTQVQGGGGSEVAQGAHTHGNVRSAGVTSGQLNVVAAGSTAPVTNVQPTIAMNFVVIT